MRLRNNNYTITISFARYFIYIIANRDQTSSENNSTIKYRRVGENSRAISAEIARVAKVRECQSVVQRIFLKIYSTK